MDVYVHHDVQGRIYDFGESGEARDMPPQGGMGECCWLPLPHCFATFPLFKSQNIAQLTVCALIESTVGVQLVNESY